MSATITAAALSAALAVASPFNIETPQQEVSELSSESCKSVHQIAGKIMEGRQSGVPMPRMMDIFADSSLGRDMVQAAYDRSRYNSQEIQEELISEFSNAWYSSCLDLTES